MASIVACTLILCVLRGSGRPYKLPPKAITPLMPLSSGGMTNILHGLAARGLIERLPDPTDRRGVLIKMTPEAVKLIDQAIAAHVAEEHRWLRHWRRRNGGCCRTF
jgi:DNA-binding MarR family transcriptional regulator